jgi:hypothetical protein
MSSARAKRLVLEALRSRPQFLRLTELPQPSTRRGRQLLLWLDQSGLALLLLNRIRAHGAETNLSKEWRGVLESRQERNSSRLTDMLGEFRCLNEAFRAKRINVVTLKGFSLVPDFCEDINGRHQTDFDFLLDPNDIEAAANVLESLGYSTACLSRTEESTFLTPLQHTPSRKDDIYPLQHHRQVDLHVSVAESSSWMKLDVPQDCQRHAVPSALRGVEFYSLSLADRFLTQVFHAFRHCFRSWLRLSWLFELGRCLEVHSENQSLWNQLVERSGNSLLTKRIFAFVLSLTNRLFLTPIPTQLSTWSSPGMTKSIRTWLDQFAVEWAISDWPGNLNNLFLASEFIPDQMLRKQYFRSRLLPKRVRMSIETMASEEKKHSLAWNLQRWKYLAHRTGIHLKDLSYLPLVQLRWKRALGAVHPKLSESES